MVASRGKTRNKRTREGEDEDNQEAARNHWPRAIVECAGNCSDFAVTHRRIMDIGGALPAKTSVEEEKEERPGRHENDDQASVKSLAGVDQLLPARSRTM